MLKVTNNKVKIFLMCCFLFFINYYIAQTDYLVFINNVIGIKKCNVILSSYFKNIYKREIFLLFLKIFHVIFHTIIKCGSRGQQEQLPPDLQKYWSKTNGVKNRLITIFFFFLVIALKFSHPPCSEPLYPTLTVFELII